ncbi:hypothetical protein RUESEDTHA_02696 [Ruegeria sp. THAF57]|uniref:hypothetical protein n=1 Tax=Ruegeria sp. THAF57 TaxID=2744555 RepID=UPI0015E05CD3|nr:hypothetical protein [Ruegeria sp. THAF57]CAD0185796.1 hypothetical protein RUESEDTHA_02696 [Ruegeria sp. THAF57]
MVRDIWLSFRELPLWVQFWMAFILIPVNLAPLAFVDQPQGALIAALSVTGMALNIPIMRAARGMTKAMALPHLVCWVPMLAIVIMLLMDASALSPGYVQFLMLLLVVDLISLGFDVNDSIVWLRERQAEQ